ncbi:MAG: hypothetical protein DSY83_14945 [Flavobacteriia bacterium]|nr:MAG: hypothetical protein DSY83_14945 [Flavobacteriia bacterium]
MDIYLTLMGVLFLPLVILNLRRGLDKKWLIWTLGTIAVLVAIMYIASYIQCKIKPGPLCGLPIIVVWLYAAPPILNIQQIINLMRRKRKAI